METSPVTETVGPDIPTLASSHSLWMAKSKENLDLIEQTKGLMEECNCLKFQLNQIRLKQKVRKRARRTAKEIERKFTCPLCSRAYGSEGSLRYHNSLKHKRSASTAGN